MTGSDPALAQLREEIGARLYALLILDDPDAIVHATDDGVRIADGIWAELTSPDRDEAADAVDAVMAALWPGGAAPPEGWRATPLGRRLSTTATMNGAAADHDDAETSDRAPCPGGGVC